MKILFGFISYFFKYGHFKFDILFCSTPRIWVPEKLFSIKLLLFM